MKQATNLKDVENPVLLPGITLNTSPTRLSSDPQMQLMRWNGKTLGPVRRPDRRRDDVRAARLRDGPAQGRRNLPACLNRGSEGETDA